MGMSDFSAGARGWESDTGRREHVVVFGTFRECFGEPSIGAAAIETGSGAAKMAGGHDEASTYAGFTAILSAT